MLGFMGTVIGMIGAFDAIEAAGDINPSLVAGGIKVALLTTVFGLMSPIASPTPMLSVILVMRGIYDIIKAKLFFELVFQFIFVNCF